MRRNPELEMAQRRFGIHFVDANDLTVPVDFYPDGVKEDFGLAMDAQPALVTVSNAGIPQWLSNYIDPKLIEILVAPNKAAEIYGEAKKGDWVTQTTTFPVIEHTGEVSNYGDWNENGSTGANANFPQRQSLHYQTLTQWGERQLAIAALARIDWASRLNIASAMVLNKFQNLSYFFGVAGLQNYGALNDPGLPASLTPATKAYSGGTGVKWVVNNVVMATANEIFTDIQSLYIELTTQLKGLVDKDTAMTLAMSPQSEMALTATNSFNVNVSDLLKKNFTNLKIKSAPQFSTAAGELVQMFAENIENQESIVCAFTEKLRAHAIVKLTSAFMQKKSQGTWGAIVFRPVAFASMLGV